MVFLLVAGGRREALFLAGGVTKVCSSHQPTNDACLIQTITSFHQTPKTWDIKGGINPSTLSLSGDERIWVCIMWTTAAPSLLTHRQKRRYQTRIEFSKILGDDTIIDIDTQKNTAKRLKTNVSNKFLTRKSSLSLQFFSFYVAVYSKCGLKDTETDVLRGSPHSAICVRKSDGSLKSAIHNAYRISLRPSSMHEPRHPLLKVFLLFQKMR